MFIFQVSSLFLAVSGEHEDIVELLLENKEIDVNIKIIFNQNIYLM